MNDLQKIMAKLDEISERLDVLEGRIALIPNNDPWKYPDPPKAAPVCTCGSTIPCAVPEHIYWTATTRLI